MWWLSLQFITTKNEEKYTKPDYDKYGANFNYILTL